MSISYHYATVAKAIDELREKGFDEDFNLEGNYLSSHAGRFGDSEFDIEHIYFYEGESNPDDEATVYGITSIKGHKGILVTGSDVFITNTESSIIKKLLAHHNK
ncbi:hypothetical protein ACLI1A_18475 [Flavobacterium sp. RHBU_3]|uniref:hypothetical protein n=1 Tax=Flavobacterium sp. RHBU_3 TaxID=3391184 RepID=UPI0039850720